MDLTARNLGLTRRFTQPVVEATRSTFGDFLSVPVRLELDDWQPLDAAFETLGL